MLVVTHVMTPCRTCSLNMGHINLSGYCEQGLTLFGSKKKYHTGI